MVCKRICKVLAAVCAVVLSIVGGLGAFSASASQSGVIRPINNYDFSYTVSATSENVTISSEPTRVIKLTIAAKSNPGVTNLQFRIDYDSDSCTYLDCHRQNATNFNLDVNDYPESNCLVTYSIYLNDKDVFRDKFIFDFYFEVNDGYLNEHEFTVGLIGFMTRENQFLTYTAAETQVPQDSIGYILGDLNDDTIIDATDARECLLLIEYYKEHVSSTGSLTKTYLNQKLRSSAVWRNAFPNLVCAEVADVDHSNIINDTDAHDILECWSIQMAGGSIEDKMIGKKYVKVI